MTVSIANNVPHFIATASQTVFTVAYKIDAATDIEAYDRPPASTGGDSAFLKILTTDYTVAFTPGTEGATITFLVGITAGNIVTLKNARAVERANNFADLSKLPASDLNDGYDNSIRYIQMALDYFNQAALFYNFSESTTTNQRNIPTLANNEQWAGNATGTVSAVAIEDPATTSVLRAQLLDITGGAEGTRRIGHTGETLFAKLAAIDSGDPTGTIKFGIYSSTPPVGYIILDDGTIGNSSSNASNRKNADTENLFTNIWTETIDAWVPIFTSAGVLSTRGATAAADFAANKAISLGFTKGRAIGNMGKGDISSIISSVATGTEQITIPDTNHLLEGNPVTFTTTGTLPAGISLATTYFVTIVSATEFKISTTTVNVIAGTFVNITSAGTGTHTVHYETSNRVMGEFIGEEDHLTLLNQLPVHGHSTSTGDYNLVGTRFANTDGVATGNITTGDAGGSLTHNNIQPCTFFRHIIKL